MKEMVSVKTVEIQEGEVRLIIPSPKKYALDAKAPVFYNPAMKLNRDISVILCKVLKPLTALDLLTATGIRGLRLKKEAKVPHVYINDASPTAFSFIKKNAAMNKLKINAFNLRAHEFLATKYKLKHSRFGYIDIDPFGTPVPFLDAGINALVENRKGIIAVTATDTSALCGTYPSACLRKYGSKPLYNYMMNEVGLRILIKKVQEIAAQYEIALTPVFAHTTRHYMRAYLVAERGADKTDAVIKQIGCFSGAGPMWLGPLCDIDIVDKMQMISLKDKNISDETRQLLFTIKNECAVNVVGFYDLAEMNLSKVPKTADVIKRLQEKGFMAARTHFCTKGTGIKTNAAEKEFNKIVKSI